MDARSKFFFEFYYFCNEIKKEKIYFLSLHPSSQDREKTLKILGLYRFCKRKVPSCGSSWKYSKVVEILVFTNKSCCFQQFRDSVTDHSWSVEVWARVRSWLFLIHFCGYLNWWSSILRDKKYLLLYDWWNAEKKTREKFQSFKNKFVKKFPGQNLNFFYPLEKTSVLQTNDRIVIFLTGLQKKLLKLRRMIRKTWAWANWGG